MTRGLGLKGGFARNGREVREDAPKGKVPAVAAGTLAVGAGIAKPWRRARLPLFRGLAARQALKFSNRKDGFDEPSGKDKGDVQAAVQRHLLFAEKLKERWPAADSRTVSLRLARSV